MEKLKVSEGQKILKNKVEQAIKKGNIDEVLKALDKARSEGVVLTPAFISKASECIIKNGTPKQNVEFAISYGGLGAKVDGHSMVVAKFGSCEDNYDCANFVNGLENSVNEIAIIQSADPNAPIWQKAEKKRKSKKKKQNIHQQALSY